MAPFEKKKTFVAPFGEKNFVAPFEEKKKIVAPFGEKKLYKLHFKKKATLVAPFEPPTLLPCPPLHPL